VTAIKQVAGAIGALAVLAGCGGGADSSDGAESEFAQGSASTIQKASVEDMQSLDALHMEGSITQQGSEVGINISLTTDGDCSGTVSRGDSGEAEVVSLDGTSWFRPDEEFWRAQAGPQAETIISTVGDKWVQLPEGDSSFASFCDLQGLLDQVGTDNEKDSATKGETSDIGGREAIQLTTKDEQGGSTSSWVAVDDPHYIVKVDREGGESPGSITFSEFGEDASIEAPADDEVITVEELQKQAQG